MVKEQEYHYDHEDRSEQDLPSEFEQASEVSHEYGDTYQHYQQQHVNGHPEEQDAETYENINSEEVLAESEQYRTQDQHVYDHEASHEEEVQGDEGVRASINSFDQVAEEVANDLNVFDQVEDEELRDLAALIPERNHDRLFSEEEAGPDASGAVSEIPEEEPLNVELQHVENHIEEQNVEQHVQQEYHHEEGEHVEHASSPGHAAREPEHHASTGNSRRNYGDPSNHDSDDDMPGAPPSFIFRTERVSRNVSDAIANIWDRFWAEDVRQIVQIIKNRFSQIMPYIRRFLAHLVAFWGGITYIRRALAAFLRILNRDERVRELLERIGWATTTTVRVFLSICAMLMQATLQIYYLVRDRVIPDTRRVIPIIYYKAVVGLLRAAERSPWSLVLGPFSLTFAIDASKLPDRYLLHTKFAVPEEDVTFDHGGMQTLVQSVRNTIARSRYGTQQQAAPEHHQVQTEADPYETHEQENYASQQQNEPQHQHASQHGYGSHTSTPVHSQTTDEMPYPPPSSYTVSRTGDEAVPHHRHPTKSGGKRTHKYGTQSPLTERTNDDHWVSRKSNAG